MKRVFVLSDKLEIMTILNGNVNSKMDKLVVKNILYDEKFEKETWYMHAYRQTWKYSEANSDLHARQTPTHCKILFRFCLSF